MHVRFVIAVVVGLTAGCGASASSARAPESATFAQSTESETASSAAAPAAAPQAPSAVAEQVLAPSCENVDPSFGGDACSALFVVCGDLLDDSTAECVVQFSFTYGDRTSREWRIVQRVGDRYRTLRDLYDAEGFTPEHGTQPEIRDRRIHARGAWDCSDCGCTEGQVAIAIEFTDAEPRVSIAERNVTSDPGECDGP